MKLNVEKKFKNCFILYVTDQGREYKIKPFCFFLRSDCWRQQKHYSNKRETYIIHIIFQDGSNSGVEQNALSKLRSNFNQIPKRAQENIYFLTMLSKININKYSQEGAVLIYPKPYTYSMDLYQSKNANIFRGFFF